MASSQNSRATQGRRLVTDGALLEMRTKLHVSRTRLASLIGVAPSSLKGWEAGTQRMNEPSALRVLKWYEDTLPALQYAFRLPLEKLMPAHRAAEQMGVTLETIEQKCRNGHLRYEDLGPFGLYVYHLEPLESV